MSGVGHSHDYRVNHGQVEGGGHPVVQEGRVEHLAVVVEAVFLVERPANALHGAALNLALHLAGVDSLAAVLDGGEPEQFHFAGIGVKPQRRRR